MTDKPTQQPVEQPSTTVSDESARRDFLKKLGKYSAFASVATVTLMTVSKRSAASDGGDIGSPPPSPSG